MCARRVPDSFAYSRQKENTVRRFADDLLWQAVTVRTLHENKETKKKNRSKYLCSFECLDRIKIGLEQNNCKIKCGKSL